MAVALGPSLERGQTGHLGGVLFTRLIGKLEGPVVEGEKTKVLKAYVKDGWRKERQEVKQE